MVRESPIYAGIPANTVTTFSASTATTKTICTGDSANGSVVSGLSLYKPSGVAITITIKTTIGPDTITISKTTLSSAADLTINLLSSTYFPFIDNSNPVLPLKPSQDLKIEVNSAATTLDVLAIVSPFS